MTKPLIFLACLVAASVRAAGEPAFSATLLREPQGFPPKQWDAGSAGWTPPVWSADHCEIPAAAMPGLVNARRKTPNGPGSLGNPLPAAPRLNGAPRKEVSALTPSERATLRHAFALLNALPDDDPRSIANFDRAYCSSLAKGLYGRPGGPTMYFVPFHRAYLYYIERVMRHLLREQAAGDQVKLAAANAFALPYWDWEKPLDSIYVRGGALAKVRPADLGAASSPSPAERARLTEAWMAAAKSAPNPFLIPDTSAKPRQLPHGWMQNVLSSSRMPLFYAHHANVDRMWSQWVAAQLGSLPSSAFPNAIPFVLPDENGNWVRVKPEQFAKPAAYK